MKTPCTEVDLGPGHIVLDGTQLPRKRGTAAPLFSAHVYCGHSRPSQPLLSSWKKIWRSNPWFLVPICAENGEIYSECLSTKWTNYGFMHEKWGSNIISWPRIELTPLTPCFRCLWVAIAMGDPRYGGPSLYGGLVPAAKTQNPLKFAGVPQTNETISAASRPKFTILWGTCGGDIAA